MKKLWITATAALIGLALTFAAVLDDTDGQESIKGLWAREMPDDGVRFYYFHGDGNGLYRYGRVAFTNTHSYDYSVDGKTIALHFRKTGEKRAMKFRVEGEGDKRQLVIDDDPREAGATTRYRYVPVEAVDLAKGPDGRMWIAFDEFKTGGAAFSMYQLTPAGIEGRGTGWHHRGDFNNWSTEALTYRMRGAQMALRFELTEETYATPFALEEGERRTLTLERDPRNWWQRSRFVDMGKSFDVGGSMIGARLQP